MARQRRRRSRRTIIITTVAVLVVVLAGVGLWVRHAKSTPAAAAETTTSATATVQTMKQTASATGTINPAQQAVLSFGQSGTVTGVDVKVGDTVSTGQTLAAIDPTSLQQAVTLAQAQVNAAQAQLTAAVSAANTSQQASANAQLVSAQTKLSTAQTALAQANLTSTMNGTVAAVSMNVGDRVTGSSSGASGSGSGGSSGGSASGSGGGSGAGGSGSSGSSASSTSTDSITVISTQSWQVVAQVSAADLPTIQPNMQATITPSGATQPVFGTVQTVGIVATTTNGTSTFPVTIAITGNPTGLYAGSAAAVSITTKSIPDVLTVPTAAIYQENGQTVVHQDKDGQTVSTPVTIGTVYGSVTQVTKGISEGDSVLVPQRSGAGAYRTGTGTGASATRSPGAGGYGGGAGGTGGGPGGGAANGAAPAGGGN